MADHLAKAEDFETKAEKKINGWNFFGSKYEEAADLLAKSANSFKLSKSWDRAGLVFIKLANCYLKIDSNHEAADAYVDAAHCFKKTSAKGAVSCLDESVKIYMHSGRQNTAAKYYKEIAELYEQDRNVEKAILYFERAAELFQLGESASLANQCKLKIAQFSAELEEYQKAIELFEEITQYSLNNNLLKYGVRGHLLNAGICQLCQGDYVAITNSLERYQDFDPAFSRTWEYKFLAGLVAAIDEEDVANFTGVVKEYDSISQLDSWKTTLLLRVKNALKAKELEEEDLT